MEQQEVRMFEQKPVRMVKTETGIYYSMVDVIAALQISPNPTRYWSDWKRSQKKAAEKQKSTYDPAQSISEKSGFEQKDRVMHVNYTNIVSVDSRKEKASRCRCDGGKDAARTGPALSQSFDRTVSFLAGSGACV